MQDPFNICRNKLVKISLEPEIPTKKISNANFEQFKSSEGYFRILDFIVTMNQSFQTLQNNTDTMIPAEIQQLIKVLDQVEEVALEIVPQFDTSRFGSISFRDLIGQIEAKTESWHSSIAAQNPHKREMEVYFWNSFGDKTRMDYGSGHELNYMCWLLCLYLTGYFNGNHSHFKLLFTRYLKLMRLIQIRFRLEPAGSHGVWVFIINKGLDDYQFLPFYFGSAELIDSKIPPASVIDMQTVNRNSEKFMYFGGIKFIMENKSGAFFENSPVLYDISGVPTWSKINSGLLKMYEAEVVGKFVVAQHIYFGSLIPFEPAHNL